MTKLYKFGIKKIETFSKLLIPKKFHPFFTPLKQKLYLKTHKKLTCIWFITWECNFACPYCWQREDPRTYRKKFDISSVDWLKAWERISDDFDEIVVGISGGEPFIVKDFIYMLSKLPDNIKYDITSNLSFDCDEFLSYEKIRKNCVGIICSFHPSNPTNRENYIQEFFSKVKKLSVLPNTRVNFVAAPPNLKFYNMLKEWCEKNKVLLHVDRYTPLKKGLEFNEEERKFAESIISPDRRNIDDSKSTVLCSAGSSHIVLFPDGSVWPCLKKAEEKQDGLASFLSNTFSLNKKWIRCDYYPLCAGCDYDNIQVKRI